MRKDMKRKLVNTTYFDSLYYGTEFPYKDYREMCEECERDCHEENSPEWWQDMQELTDEEWDCFKDNMRYSKFKGLPCMITGSLGLRHGNPTIVPVKCDDIMEAIEKCLDNNYPFEYVISLKDGHIEVDVTHHDGTNCFEIHLLSKKGIREANRPIYEWEKDYEPKRWWFKNIYGYLY